jgi:adenosylmethionine-8-amino-7-oxononanoate aminotransferase
LPSGCADRRIRPHPDFELAGAVGKIAGRLQAEMVKRGVVTRARPVAGPHPAPGDGVFLAPPLVITSTQVDTIVDVARESARAVFGC